MTNNKLTSRLILYSFLTLELLISSQCFSSFESLGGSARYMAMGGTGVGNANTVDAIFMNCSGLALTDGIGIAVNYANPFGIRELTVGSVSALAPVFGGNIGIATKAFGNSYYTENEFILSFARVLRGKFFYGANIRYMRLSIAKYGSDSAVGLDAGFTAPVNKRVQWGFFASNLNRPKIGLDNEVLPQTISSGFSIHTLENLIVNADVFKDTRFPLELRFGFEYLVLERLSLRSGFITEIGNFTAGFGINFQFIDMDYSFQTHHDLGFTHQFTLTFSLKKNKSSNKQRSFLENIRKININEASAEELQELTGVGPALANRIIKYREEFGNFDNIEEIQNVKGIGEKMFAKISPYITVE